MEKLRARELTDQYGCPAFPVTGDAQCIMGRWVVCACVRLDAEGCHLLSINLRGGKFELRIVVNKIFPCVWGMEYQNS